MCEFQSLYFGDDGYVVRCEKCNYYQVAYGSTMLNLTPGDFDILIKVVQRKCAVEEYPVPPHSKSVVIPTPSAGFSMLFTKDEAMRFYEILEEADNEVKAQSLISLFNAQ